MEIHARKRLRRTCCVGDWLKRLLNRLGQRYQVEKEIRRSTWELRRCDDRMLRDIGVARREIEGSCGAVRGDERPSDRVPL